MVHSSLSYTDCPQEAVYRCRQRRLTDPLTTRRSRTGARVSRRRELFRVVLRRLVGVR